MTETTNREIAVPSNRLQPAVGQPARIGQGTVVEQSRAVAEVQAAIVVAQNCPRNSRAAIEAARDSCGRKALADRAFFRFARAGQNITGPTVHLARELARCWGNVQYGITELRRDDEYGQSEMQAWAWDVQTNTRVSSTFIVPHRRDTRSGATTLTDQRDIYENNANNAARRLREAIFDILPPWFTEEAIEVCNRTLEHGEGVPLPTRIANLLKHYALIGVTEGQLESKMGRPSGEWTPFDVSQLGVIFQSIKRGETTREEEFPEERTSASEITGGQGNGKARNGGRQQRQADRPQAEPKADKPAADAAEGDNPWPTPESY